MKTISRRHFLSGLGGCALAVSTPSLASTYQAQKGLVIGAGPRGLNYALSLQNEFPKMEVILLDKTDVFAPVYRSVLAPKAADQSKLQLFLRQGGMIKKEDVLSLKTAQQFVTTASGNDYAYDLIAWQTGYRFKEASNKLEQAVLDGKILHGWTDHDQANLLWDQVQKLEQGAIMIFALPRGEIRYEEGVQKRIAHIANYLALHNPTATLLVFDPEMRTYGSFQNVKIKQRQAVDLLADQSGVVLENGKIVKADLLNVIPAQEKHVAFL